MNVNDLLNTIQSTNQQNIEQQKNDENTNQDYYNNDYFKSPLPMNNLQSKPTTEMSKGIAKNQANSSNKSTENKTNIDLNLQQKHNNYSNNTNSQMREVPIPRCNIQTTNNISGSLKQSYISPSVNNYHRNQHTNYSNSNFEPNRQSQNSNFNPNDLLIDTNQQTSMQNYNSNIEATQNLNMQNDSQYFNNDFTSNTQQSTNGNFNQNNNTNTNTLTKMFGNMDLSALSNLLGSNLNLSNLVGNNGNNANMMNMLSNLIPLLSNNNGNKNFDNNNGENKSDVLANLFSNFNQSNKHKSTNNQNNARKDSKIKKNNLEQFNDSLNDYEDNDFNFDDIIKIDDA